MSDSFVIVEGASELGNGRIDGSARQPSICQTSSLVQSLKGDSDNEPEACLVATSACSSLAIIEILLDWLSSRRFPITEITSLTPATSALFSRRARSLPCGWTFQESAHGLMRLPLRTPFSGVLTRVPRPIVCTTN